jgi:hypothetical protein
MNENVYENYNPNQIEPISISNSGDDESGYEIDDEKSVNDAVIDDCFNGEYDIDCDEYESEDETNDYELFSELNNDEGLRLNLRPANMLNTSNEINNSSIYYTVNNGTSDFNDECMYPEYEEEARDEEEDNDLDYTPVKLDDINRKYNYTGLLRFDSVNLPPLNNSKDSQIVNSNNNNNGYVTPIASNVNNSKTKGNSSTLKAKDRSRVVYPATQMGAATPFVVPYPTNKNLKNVNSNTNYSSDTDSSLQVPCCSMPLKFKW